MLQAGIKPRKYLRQLGLDIAHRNPLQEKTVAAVFAIPRKSIQFVGSSAPLHDDADAACGSLRRVRYFRRQEIHLTSADGYVGQTAVLHRLEHHVPLDLIEELCAGVVMKILAGVRSADRHDDESAVLEQQLVAHGRLEQVAVLLDPSVQIERCGWHGAIIAAMKLRWVQQGQTVPEEALCALFGGLQVSV